MKSLIKAQMKANGGSTIFTTQTMTEAEALCDRIAIMVNGGVCCSTETEKLKELVGGYYLTINRNSHIEKAKGTINNNPEVKKHEKRERESFEQKDFEENIQVKNLKEYRNKYYVRIQNPHDVVQEVELKEKPSKDDFS